MKKFVRTSALMLLILAMCLTLSLLTSCGGEKEGGEQETEIKKYNISVEKPSVFGEVSAEAKKTDSKGTLYEITVTPKVGYAVKSFKIGGIDASLTDNKIECILNGDTSVLVEYQRKTNDELEARREKVLKKMQLITGTQFKYDRSYDYLIAKKDWKINAGAIYQGMPYANNPTVSFEAFLDFCSGPDANGVYTVGDILAHPQYVWGNNCADVVYWSWATVSTTIKCTYTGMFWDKFGVVKVGDYDIAEEEMNKDCFIETIDTCKRNGMQKMFEAYGMLMKGDGLVMYHPGGGHAIMAGESVVVREADGTINGDRSYIMYYDQNSGYSQKTGVNGRPVTSSCAYNVKMTYTKMFTDGYLPVTCNELMDESFAVAEETVKDSIDPSGYTKINVTRGYVESNYYIAKARMEITDANGNVVYAGNRYRDESNPYRISLSWFNEDTTPSYTNMSIYEKFNVNNLAPGNYHCKLTILLGTGSEHVVRDFDFTN